jgi:hypothetical protein
LIFAGVKGIMGHMSNQECVEGVCAHESVAYGVYWVNGITDSKEIKFYKKAAKQMHILFSSVGWNTLPARLQFGLTKGQMHFTAFAQSDEQSNQYRNRVGELRNAANSAKMAAAGK